MGRFNKIFGGVSDAWKDWGKDALAVAMPVFYSANGGRAYDAKKGRDDGTGAVAGAVSPYARAYAAIDGVRPPPDPTMPPMPAADPTAPDAQARALRRRQRMLSARGRSSTILTGPLGLTDAGSMGAPKTLLGA